MNQMMLKIASLPIDPKTGTKGEPLESGKGSRDFFSVIQRLMKSVQKRSLHRYTKLPGAGLPLEDRYCFYLESLRKGLLARGKPLNRISLNSQDLPVLKRFLYQCGFSQEGVERFLRELVENNPHGEIDLSQFFLKIDELGPPRRRIYQPITLEPSAIPYIESVLRDFGLTPREIEHALSAARVEGRGLDLDRFIIKIKQISNQINAGTQVAIDQRSVNKISIRDLSAARVEGRGLDLDRFIIKIKQISNQINAGTQVAIDQRSVNKISIRDLITALEQMKGGSTKGNQLPNDVKATIDQILERAAITEDKDRPIASLLSLSKLRLLDPLSKERKSKKGKPVERQGLLSPSKEKGTINAKNGQQRGEDPHHVRNLRSFSDLDTDQARQSRLSPAARDDGGRGLNTGAKEEGYVLKSEITIMDIPHGSKSSTAAQAINTVKQHPEPVRDFFPAYLIDQVGKQISRSILRGEKVIRLQLKPPDLGVLKVEVDIKGNILKLGMIAENSSIKELLLSNVHELREALVEQGVKLDRLDIQINYNSGQSLTNSKEGQGQELDGGPFVAEDDKEDPIPGARNMATGDHLLDLVA